MAKTPKKAKDGPTLYHQYAQVQDRRIRRQRALFIPKYVREAASSQHLTGPKQDRAYQIAVQWAELESSGHLPKYNETTIDTQFLDQLFGEGLGYQVKTKSPTDYQLDHKFAVKGGGIADAALGEFPRAASPRVIIELKGSLIDLDRDRPSGRTAVDQCWDYLNCLPESEWGIVSNFSIVRLYHKSKGKLNYEEFTLQELRDRDRFNDFYAIFERGGLLSSSLKQPPRALALLQRTEKRQKEVGDDLYESYRMQRLRLIDHLMRDEGKGLDQAIAIAQKLLDRIIFIAFCEDRDLLPEKCLERAHSAVPAFSRVKNPRWHNFLGLFGAVDKGSDGLPPIAKFNGGLFAEDKEIDDLELDDEPWTTGFKGFGGYDFSEEVNVEVLGHLFERSITELEKLRVGGLFALKANIEGTPTNGNGSAKATKGKSKAAAAPKADDESPLAKMPKSAQRKRFGIYYTPPAFTGLIVERTVDALVAQRFQALAKQHKVDPDAKKDQNPKNLLAYWRACHECLKAITVCDPACGSGAFLIRAYDSLDGHYKTVIHGLAGSGEDAEKVRTLEDAIPDDILNCNIYGVDLSREGVEITQLALWIRSARKGKTLADLSNHIIHGNSLVSDPSVDPKALDWQEAFPHIFAKGGPGGFDCVIGNPPWERVKLQNREFFSLSAPGVLDTDNPAELRRSIAALEQRNPELFRLYQHALARAEAMSRYSRESQRYPLTGRGDTNLYMLFAELARSVVAPSGVVGLLVPSGIATDEPTKEFFSDLVDRSVLVSLYDFENRNGHFPDVDGRFKFTALVFGGSETKTLQADFVFFAHDVEDTAPSNKRKHVGLTAKDIANVNPNSRTCPIFRTKRDAELTLGIYRRLPVLIDRTRKSGGNRWSLKFSTAFHQSADAELFIEVEAASKLQAKSPRKYSNLLRVYEAKMVQAFDHRAASVRVEGANWARKGQKHETSPVAYQNPEHLAEPRWMIPESDVVNAVGGRRESGFLAYKDITSATNTRTLIAAALPWCGPTHHLALAKTDQLPRREMCLLANLNAFSLDYIVRQKLGGTTLTFFIMEQLPVLGPETYEDKCPWSKQETLEDWISERVLKLSCTAEDMIPLAKACDFKGSRGDGVHIWKDAERAELRAELDAAYFILYGVERADVEYMLSTFTGTGFIAPDDRDDTGRAWERGKQGDMILEAYDHLSGLASAR